MRTTFASLKWTGQFAPILALACLTSACGEDSQAEMRTIEQLSIANKSGSAEHLAAVHRVRRIIVNDDNRDLYASVMPKTTAENRNLFFKSRLNHLRWDDTDNGSQVDTLVYEVSKGFGGYVIPIHQEMAQTEALSGSFGGYQASFDLMNKDTWYCDDPVINSTSCRPQNGQTAENCSDACPLDQFDHRFLLNQTRPTDVVDVDVVGVDPLAEAIALGHGYGREVFAGLRMNDGHDDNADKNLDYFIFSSFKRDHPENLFSAVTSDPIDSSLSDVRYENIKVRRVVAAAVKTILHRYPDVDGINLNFMRHPVFFSRNALGLEASGENIDKMNRLMEEIRAITNEAAKARGRPVLIAVQVPDSIEYSKYVGLDLLNWYDNGLVDMVVGGDYMQLSSWKKSADTVHNANPDIKFYAGFNDSRLKETIDLRETVEAFQGRASEALGDGADGIYLTNADYSKANFQTLFSTLGDLATLSGGDKVHFASFMAGGSHPTKTFPDFRAYFDDVWPIGGSYHVNVPAYGHYSVELGSGKGNEFPKSGILYLVVESLTSEQKAGAYDSSQPGLYLEVTKANGTKQRLEMIDEDYHTGTDPLRQYLQEPGTHRRFLGFRLSQQLLNVRTLKVRIVNDSTTSVFVSDLFLHSSQSTSFPKIVVSETGTPCTAVSVSGVQPFRTVKCL